MAGKVEDEVGEGAEDEKVMLAPARRKVSSRRAAEAKEDEGDDDDDEAQASGIESLRAEVRRIRRVLERGSGRLGAGNGGRRGSAEGGDRKASPRSARARNAAGAAGACKEEVLGDSPVEDSEELLMLPKDCEEPSPVTPPGQATGGARSASGAGTAALDAEPLTKWRILQRPPSDPHAPPSGSGLADAKTEATWPAEEAEPRARRAGSSRSGLRQARISPRRQSQTRRGGGRRL